MTPAERKKEWAVAFETALGRMGVLHNMRPTERQEQLARIEADEHLVKLDFEQWRKEQK